MTRYMPVSLRGRVVLAVLAFVTLLFACVFTVVDVVLADRLDAELRTRLVDRVTLADQLDGALSPQQLVDRLRGDGVSAQLCAASGSTLGGSTGASSGGRPRCVAATPGIGAPGPAATPPGRSRGGPGRPTITPAPPATTHTTVRRSGSVLSVRTVLPSSGQTLTLSTDGSQVDAAVHRLIVLEVLAGLVALVLAALALRRVVAGALRPLDSMTTLARGIAAGDRGRRLGTGRPDTELGRTATAFDTMLDELESSAAAAAAAEARLREFLRDVSHELRTPLASVAATGEGLLRDEPGRAGREHAYALLVRETRRASRLVDDLLTVARFDTGMALATERVELGGVVEHEAQRVRGMSPGLDVRLDLARPAVVDGDPIRLGQVVGNLLDNARAAAGPAGRVDVRITAHHDAWWIDVSDSGPGVPAADRERIFERMVRLDAARTRERGGFGLGLPIARMLARAHGGDVVHVDTAGGATFRVVLLATTEGYSGTAQ